MALLRQKLAAIAYALHPELRMASEPSRTHMVADLVGTLYAWPLALMGLIWLVAVTDLALLAAQWPLLLFLLALLFLFGRLTFNLYVELTRGTYFDWGGSLGTVVIWTRALIFGPTALWLPTIWALLQFSRRWLRERVTRQRWNLARNLALDLAGKVGAGLIALSIYRRWGGTWPLPGPVSAMALPALGSTIVWVSLSITLGVPLLIYWGRSPHLVGAERSLTRYVRFVVPFLGWRVFADPFAVFAAGLYSQQGFVALLFFLASLLLAGLLAHHLGQAVARSQQRSRELENLERLGRALIDARPDGSDLSDVLKRHVAGMFAFGRIEIRTVAGEILLRDPHDWPPVADATWAWLGTASSASWFALGAAVPWSDEPASHAVIVAPIRDVDGGETVGGIYLSLLIDPVAPSTLVPAVQSVAAQTASALHGAKVYARTLARQRVEQELALAGEIQASFLPTSLPEISGWQLAAALRPARETSGDFYDLIPLPNRRLGILVADVADKGMGAALYMALCRTLLRTYAVEYRTRPDHVLSVTNRRLLADSQASMFVTVFYGILDPVTSTLTYANAGHNPPYLLRAGESETAETLPRTGIALGISLGWTWDQKQVRIDEGGSLLIYSDGVTEAQNAEEVFYDEERLLSAYRALRGRQAQEIQEELLADVDAFVGDAPQFDDITMMVISHTP